MDCSVGISGPLEYLGYYLAKRKILEAQNDSSDSFREYLCSGRDQLRRLLESVHVVSDTKSFESSSVGAPVMLRYTANSNKTKAWLGAIIGGKQDNSHSLLRSLLSWTQIRLQACDGANSEPAHLLLYPRVSHHCLHDLTPRLLRAYAGNLRDHLQDLILGRDRDPKTRCWRARDGVQLCNGKAEHSSPWLSLPVLLVLTIEPSFIRPPARKTQNPKAWDFASPLNMSELSSPKLFQYDLVAFVSYSNSHFRTYFQTNSGVFRHDGIVDDGMASFMGNISLTGVLNGPGFPQEPSMVFYRLRGGIKDKEEFCKAALCRVEQELGVSVPPCRDGDSMASLRRLNYKRDLEAWKLYRDAPFMSERHEYVVSPCATAGTRLRRES
jgi:hypothetical protein